MNEERKEDTEKRKSIQKRTQERGAAKRHRQMRGMQHETSRSMRLMRQNRTLKPHKTRTVK